ncbi:aminotransferase class V-fold PLP-dependent enzyme [Williamsia phyllosphaerae]|uniref:Aminotransferase/cysteine desulfurase n=1 Tax=Williamsia phyllosphaerae TaxID=885042 RepID=A0ABQ1ULQ3_9NOCA|nr:aminotransferase class V-fold PLP-dependent enzyme [Williamsia phyllosphaerae]GGF21152.1 putative aminotransferase/cysteine desulfurase [Williamsia phyllosphaerae]
MTAVAPTPITFPRADTFFEPVRVQRTAPAGPGPIADLVGADITTALDGDERSVRYVNLDYAASAPALSVVAAEIGQALPQYASVHRGAGYLSQLTTDRYEKARVSVRRFVRARADDHVIFTRNTTDAINLLAGATPGDTVVLDIEHHANLLPWKRSGARVVTCRPTLAETITALSEELQRSPAALLAVTGASNVTGEVLPLTTLADIAHSAGARILVDAAQLAPHRALNMVSHGIDYLVFSGHKLYAPFGCGVLAGRGDWLDSAEPYLAGGGATVDVRGFDTAVDDGSDTDVQWATGPARHEAGTPNVLGAVAIAAACDAITDLGHERIGLHEHALRCRLDAGLDSISGVEPLSIWSDASDRVGIAAFCIAGRTPRAVAEFLNDSHGIGVRDGRFCAHPLLNRLGHPEGAVRVSFGLGTGADDIDRLLYALRHLTATASEGSR